MKRDVKIYIADIIESMKYIQEYTNNISPKEFYEKVYLQDAVIRRLGIIGEASSHVGQEIRKQYPQIPWRDMIALRNIVIHDYSEVIIERIWKIIKNDLPKTKGAFEKLSKHL